jgi:hypothetical protein
MIYTRFGEPVKVIAQCGSHTPQGFKVPVIMVRVQFDDQRIRHQFVEFLKADKGFQEIFDSYTSAPFVHLRGGELIKAIQEAM